jgi:uncharacterized protein with ParB-like and HNH nuclease domain
MATSNPAESQAEQLAREKRAVSYDSYDISVRQIADMVENREINIAPEYQRHFVWDEERESELIESIFLGIPIPSLFMATNSDATWEVVDGVQRISTVLHFLGDKKHLEMINKNKPLKLHGLTKLSSFNGSLFDDMPRSAQLQFLTRPLRVTTLNDKSDNAVRYDLFERLNTGAVALHPQEIRNCVFRGIFMDFIRQQSENSNFRAVVKLPDNELKSASYEECVLRFFAFRDKYKKFGHNVKEFLNEYAVEMNKKRFASEAKDFEEVMNFLIKELPDGVVRQKRKNTTPINLYEAVAVGAALALKSGKKIKSGILKSIIDDVELTRLTTGGTNSNPMVVGRIEYVRNKLIV